MTHVQVRAHPNTTLPAWGGMALFARGVSETTVSGCTLGGRGHGSRCVDAVAVEDSAVMEMDKTSLEFARMCGLRCYGEADVSLRKCEFS